MVTLRPYQREAIESLRRAYRAGKRRVIVSLPTGTGKTVVFAHFPLELKMKKRLLVLAHREELLIQAEAKFRAVSPDLRVEIEQADRRAGADAKVVIASVPTIGRAGSKRLAALNPDEFSIVVVDEAHHAVAQTYRNIFDHFGLFAPGTPRFLVGFTATPRRGDKLGLGEVFEEVAYARELRQMIGEGYLCRVTGWRIGTNLSLDGVRTRHGDFVESQLASVVDTSARNELIVKAFKELAPRRQAIAFCVNVEHARHLSEHFVEAGIRAAAVWGEMPKDERRRVLERFSAGDIQVVTNCNLLTEGFDEPRVDCVLMARPTQSRLLYAQMVGRGTRLHENKSDLLVVDIADNSRAHKLPNLGSLFKLPDNMNLRGGDALAIEERLDDIAARQPWIDTSRIGSPDDIALALERIDFFNLEPPPEIADDTRFLWCAVPGGGYRLSLPRGEWIQVDSTLLDTWEASLVTNGRGAVKLASERDLSSAIATADAFVRAKRTDAMQLVKRQASWHGQEPSEKQTALLKRHGVQVPNGLTRGQASRMIDLLMSPKGSLLLRRDQS